MKLRDIICLLPLLLINTDLRAEVPYSSLEELRKKTVVTRVVLDRPATNELKNCKAYERWHELGQALALATDNEAAAWGKSQVSSEDLKSLKPKVQQCKARASCQVYSVYLKSVKTSASLEAELKSLRSSVDALLNEMDAPDYSRALKSVSEPCKVMQNLLKELS